MARHDSGNIEDGRPFWIIWQPEHHTPATVRFKKNDAVEVANRLANTNPGKRFFVLKSFGFCESQILPSSFTANITVR